MKAVSIFIIMKGKLDLSIYSVSYFDSIFGVFIIFICDNFPILSYSINVLMYSIDVARLSAGNQKRAIHACSSTILTFDSNL